MTNRGDSPFITSLLFYYKEREERVVEMVKKTYSDEELLKILKEYNDTVGYPKARDFTPKNGLPSSGVYLNRFQSWNNAKELAGIKNARFKYRSDKYTKSGIIESYQHLHNQLKRIPTVDDIREFGDGITVYAINRHFGSINSLRIACGLYSDHVQGKYKKKFLLDEIHRFYQEFDRIPLASDFECLEGYPSRRTFSNHFGSFDDAILQAGFIPTRHKILKYNNTDFLIGEIYRYIKEYGVIPTGDDMDANEDYPSRHYFRKMFGNWNNALRAADLPVRHVHQYEDSFLESEFHRFVKENSRVPCISDFNNSEYPSFWCYQNRFGSWNQAVVHYGYEPNDSKTKYTLNDGEICASQYELIVSQWLKERNIRYDRDINYVDFIKNYNGKMNCDYRLYIDNVVWYVEVVGFIGHQDVSKYNAEEMSYYRRLTYKEKLLKRENLNYLIIYLWDLEEKELEDIFYFIR